MTAGILAAAHPEHIALPVIVVVIGLIVFAVSRRRKRQEIVDELDSHEPSSENRTPTAQDRHPAGHHGDPAEHEHRAHPH